MPIKISRTFPDEFKQFWSDTLPGATDDYIWVPAGVEPERWCKYLYLIEP